MVNFKNYESWAHTSALMALLVNINKDTKKHGTTPFDAFNPYSKGGKDPVKQREVSESEAQYNFMLMRKALVDNAEEYKHLPKGVLRVKKYIYDSVTKKEIEVKD